MLTVVDEAASFLADLALQGRLGLRSDAVIGFSAADDAMRQVRAEFYHLAILDFEHAIRNYRRLHAYGCVDICCAICLPAVSMSRCFCCR